MLVEIWLVLVFVAVLIVVIVDFVLPLGLLRCWFAVWWLVCWFL